MYTKLLAAVLVLGTATVASAQRNAAQPGTGNPPPAVQQTVNKQYPGAQTSLVNTRDENGVRVYDARVASAQGQPFTVVATEDGEMLEAVWDFGGNVQGLPPAVAEFTQNIWKTPPADVREEIG